MYHACPQLKEIVTTMAKTCLLVPHRYLFARLCRTRNFYMKHFVPSLEVMYHVVLCNTQTRQLKNYAVIYKEYHLLCVVHEATLRSFPASRISRTP